MNRHALRTMCTIVVALCAIMQVSCANRKSDNTASQEVVETGVVVNMNDSMFRSLVFDYVSGGTEWKYLGNKPAIVDFYADWCGPCRAIAPVMKELAQEYKDSLIIYKVNVDKEQDLAGWMQIRSIPALLFIPMDEMPRVVVGQNTKEFYKEVVDSFLLKK